MIKKLDDLVDKLTKWAIVACILLMLLLSLLGIVLRWFELSLPWVDPLVRHLVFISTFLGGSLAIKTNHHIKIDLLGRILEKQKLVKSQIILERLVVIITLMACSILVYGSYELTKIEFEMGKAHFLGIHSGYLLGIIPVGMGLICLRILFRLFMPVRDLEWK